MSMRKGAALAAVACLLLTGVAWAAQGVVVLPSSPVGPYVPMPGAWPHHGPTMAAYQRAYAMNFEIWQPAGLPAGWYATFDGFPVAQVAKDRWVYGRMGIDGALVPTDVLVGSVVPSDVPGLTRVATTWIFYRYFADPEFQRVLELGCDHMAFLDDLYVRTAVAWTAGKPGVWVWLCDHWKKILPRSGEYTWQALKRHRPWLAEELRKCHMWWWTGSEPMDLTDLARQWGMIWMGRMGIEKLGTWRDGGGGGGGVGGTFRDAPGRDAPSDQGGGGGGRWDVDDGGDWDTGR